MSSGSPTGQLLNINDLAREFGCTRRTLHRWLKAGTCPVAPVPGMKPPKFLIADVNAFVRRDA